MFVNDFAEGITIDLCYETLKLLRRLWSHKKCKTFWECSLLCSLHYNQPFEDLKRSFLLNILEFLRPKENRKTINSYEKWKNVVE